MALYCMICGKELVLTSNFMVSDTDEEIESCGGDDAMITYAQCPNCGVHYEMIDASPNEMDEDPLYVGSCRLWNEEETEKEPDSNVITLSDDMVKVIKEETESKDE